MPFLLNLALKKVPAEFAGAASGVYSTVQQTASALGISIIGGLFLSFSEHKNGPDSFTEAFHYGMGAEIGFLAVTALILYFALKGIAKKIPSAIPAES